MELKLGIASITPRVDYLLIVPYGIETTQEGWMTRFTQNF